MSCAAAAAVPPWASPSCPERSAGKPALSPARDSVSSRLRRVLCPGPCTRPCCRWPAAEFGRPHLSAFPADNRKCAPAARTASGLPSQPKPASVFTPKWRSNVCRALPSSKRQLGSWVMVLASLLQGMFAVGTSSSAGARRANSSMRMTAACQLCGGKFAGGHVGVSQACSLTFGRPRPLNNCCARPPACPAR